MFYIFFLILYELKKFPLLINHNISKFDPRILLLKRTFKTSFETAFWETHLIEFGVKLV